MKLESEGFTQVHSRGSNWLKMKNPITGKISLDVGIGGGWHHGEGIETDTAWLPGVAPWSYQMINADYNLFALSDLSSGQIIKWVDPVSGQSITFQPMALQWTNALNQIQHISMPASVAAQASDDVLYWPGAYGSGRHFKYIASPTRLNKLLIIDSPSALPTTSYDTLELNFIISVSSGVDIMVNGVAWGKKTQKDTTSSIVFQLPGGAVLWSFTAPRAWDSSGNPEATTTGSMRLKKSGSRLYVSVRFPKAWIDSVSADYYPIIFDPTVNYSVTATADDAIWVTANDPTFSNNWPYLILGRGGSSYNNAMRFAGVTIPDGATIDVAYITFIADALAGTPPACILYFEDAANPSALSSAADGDARILTTATTSITGSAAAAGTAWHSPSLVLILNELMESNSYAAGAAMQCIIKNFTSVNNQYSAPASGNNTNYDPPLLHIEYTPVPVSGSSWAGTWGG